MYVIQIRIKAPAFLCQTMFVHGAVTSVSERKRGDTIQVIKNPLYGPPVEAEVLLCTHLSNPAGKPGGYGFRLAEK